MQILIRRIKPPQLFTYKNTRNLLGSGWLICQGDTYIAFTTQEAFAKAICSCMNNWYAVINHLPIRFGLPHSLN